MTKRNKLMVRATTMLLFVSLLLAGTGVVWAASNPAPVKASCPCMPGVACCVTNTQCGWCHSHVCPGGYGVLYNGNLKVCYNSSCQQTSVNHWCSYVPCGVGQCQ